MKTDMFVSSQISARLLSPIGHILRINEIESGENGVLHRQLRLVLCLHL